MRTLVLFVFVVAAGIARAQPALFSDGFQGKLAAGWSWVRENPAGWRMTTNGLQVLLEPGNMWGGQNNARNVLVRPLPSADQENLEVAVTVENMPSNQYEQVDLVWYYDDSNMVKIGLELVDRELCLVMGREERDQTRTIAKLPLGPDSTRLRVRFLTSKNQLRGEYRLADATEWKRAGECDMPAPKGMQPRVSLQCYQGLVEQNHWATLTDFRISKVGEN
jgi:regulation of enolase protein 1 (concanavalin A-like superfamily)